MTTQLASDIDAAASPAVATGFLATTRHGALRLALRRTSAWPPRIAAPLRAAALLADAEPLLQWLEDWLGEPLDPAPCDASPATEVPMARLHWRAGELVATAALPWAALLACRPAPELVGFWRDAVRWDELALQLVLAHEALDDDEWQSLQQPGAGWLLRDSFSADGRWPCELRLQAGDDVQAWPALWQADRGRLAWSGESPVRRPEAGNGTLAVLSRPLRLTPPALLGWHGETSCDCAAGQPVWLLAAPRHGRGTLAAQLVPIGLRGGGAESAPLHAGYVLQVDAG